MRWGRWGTVAASHLFEGDRQLCKTRHLFFDKGQRGTFVTFSGYALTPHGVPYGRTCARCLKLFRARKKKP